MMTRVASKSAFALLVVAASSSACHAAEPQRTPVARDAAVTTPAKAAPAALGPLGGARPVRSMHAPKNTAVPAPVILTLHGYGGDGPMQMDWSGLASVDAWVLAPDGLRDAKGNRFWNASAACCDFYGNGVDDVHYLLGLIDDLAARQNVDRTRVYAVGLSNGGAMALRLACDAADTFAAVVSFAGPVGDKDTGCTPSASVSVRLLHGTADPIVPYAGGKILDGIDPHHGSVSAIRGVFERWGNALACDSVEQLPGALDFDRSVPGAETRVAHYAHCRDGAAVELFTMTGTGHVPPLATSFATSTWEFLSAHARK